MNNKNMTMKRENEQKIVDARSFIYSKYRDTGMSDWDKYYTHDVNVFKLLKIHDYGISQQLCGLLHNLLKNTDTTLNEIIKYSDIKVEQAIEILSLANIEFITEEYMDKVSQNEIALPVSLADRLEKLNSISNRLRKLDSTSNSSNFIHNEDMIINDTVKYFDIYLMHSPFKKDYCKVMGGINTNKRR